MARKIGYVFLVITIVLTIVVSFFVRKFNNSFFRDHPNHLEYSMDTSAISFNWGKQTFGEFTESHTAMLIPVTIDGLNHKFYFQVDTGAPNSKIYGNTLNSIQNFDFKTNQIDRSEFLFLENFKMSLGGSKVNISKLQILEGYGSQVAKNDTITAIVLGTIGSDFLDNRVTVFDFKNQFIKIFTKRPDWMNRISEFSPFDFDGRRFMFPVSIEGKELKLLYDSGCSAFGLITSKHRYEKYTRESENEIAYVGNGWGESLPIHHKPSSSKLQIGGSDLPVIRISFVDMYGPFQRFMTPFTRIGGFLGNKPFLDYTLILDTQTEEFAVVRSTLNTSN